MSGFSIEAGGDVKGNAITVDHAPRSSEKKYIFAVVPKQLKSPFFEVVQSGCMARAKKLQNVECWYNGTEYVDVYGQANIIVDLVAQGVDGIAVAIADEKYEVVNHAIASAIDAGIPVITFDSDATNSKRLTYIGTDNYAFGQTLGKVLLQIDPTGGYYGVISTQAPNAIERERGLRTRLAGSKWIEHSSSPMDCLESGIIGIQKMKDLIQFPEVKAIVPTGGWPMRNITLWEELLDANPNITTIGSDALPHQIDLLNRDYVNGLVGQVPFQMGSSAMDILLAHTRGESIPEEIHGTTLLEMIAVPSHLPEVTVDMHYIGNLQYIGFIFSATVMFLAIGLGLWTFMNRNLKAVKASQPVFLIMITVGVTIMGASMIPMSFDDGNLMLDVHETCKVACMSTIWLFSVGFTTVFSALYSKTWRINRIFHNPNRFSRVTVTASDAMLPFAVLLFANVLTLSLFTALAPLTIIRQDHAGTDDWNRVISTFGTCQSITNRWGGSAPYYVTLVVINLTALIVANIQAYQARSIQAEFSESRYIAMSVASLLQTSIIAFPILYLVRELPQVSYLLKVCIVFINCMVILLCMFVPKISREVDPRPSHRLSVSGMTARDKSPSSGGGPILIETSQPLPHH